MGEVRRMFRKMFIIFIVMFFTSTAAKHLLVETEDSGYDGKIDVLRNPPRKYHDSSKPGSAFEGGGADDGDYKRRNRRKKNDKRRGRSRWNHVCLDYNDYKRRNGRKKNDKRGGRSRWSHVCL